MDPSSPFASFEKPKQIGHSTTVYVNFCTICHYVWKAPAPTKTCVNCVGNGECAVTLAKYETEAPQI